MPWDQALDVILQSKGLDMRKNGNVMWIAPKEELHGRVTDASRAGFLEAMDISCYSFIHLTHLAEPLMKDGGCLLTTTYYGGEKVIPHYGLMGPVKSALEGTVKYLAAELGSDVPF